MDSTPKSNNKIKKEATVTIATSTIKLFQLLVINSTKQNLRNILITTNKNCYLVRFVGLSDTVGQEFSYIKLNNLIVGAASAISK